MEQPVASGAPVADFGPDGWIPISTAAVPSSGGPFQWVSASGTQPGAYVIKGTAEWLVDRLVYEADLGDQSHVVTERPGDARSIPGLPQAYGLATLQSEWALFQGGTANAIGRVRFNETTGELVTLQPISGQSAPQLDDDGSVFLSRWDDQAAAVYRTGDLGHSFEVVGDSVARGADMFVLDVQARSGTYVIQPASQQFVPSMHLLTQVVRPAEKIRFELEWGTSVLRGDGLCIAQVLPGARLQLLSVRPGTTVESPIQVRSDLLPAWID